MLPIGITILIFRFFFDLLDPIFQPVLNRVPWLDQACDSFSPAGTTCPGLGLVMLLLIIYLVGLITAHVVGRRVVQLGHTVMEAIPVVKSVYSTARSAVDMLSPPKNQPYSRVVFVDFPRRGLKSLGLVTAHLGIQDGQETLAVYVPSSPLPSTGFLVIVPAKDVISSNMTVDDALKILVSGGILARDIYIPSSLGQSGASPHEPVMTDKQN